MEEQFDTYDINGKYLGVKPKSFCHGANPECYHKVVWIWIINNAGEILVQKRAANKKVYPCKWDMPSAGHVTAGEKILDACVRETDEELGLKTKQKDFIFLKELLIVKSNEIAEVFLFKTHANINDFILQENEIAEVKYLKYDDFIKLLYSDYFCPHSTEYKNWVCKELKKYV